MKLNCVIIPILIYFKNVIGETLLNLIRTERAVPYQGNFVEPEYFVHVRNGDHIPANAVRPFERSLRFGNRTLDVVVALWIPESDFAGVWGRAWEEDGRMRAVFIHDNEVKTSSNPELARGFRILTYSGSYKKNGFKFSWVKSSLADGGTVVYSGRNMHVPSVFVEDGKYEFLGDADWHNRMMDYVFYGTYDFHTVGNYPGHRVFDNDVYVLTKQKCNCVC